MKTKYGFSIRKYPTSRFTWCNKSLVQWQTNHYTGKIHIILHWNYYCFGLAEIKQIAKHESIVTLQSRFQVSFYLGRNILLWFSLSGQVLVSWTTPTFCRLIKDNKTEWMEEARKEGRKELQFSEPVLLNATLRTRVNGPEYAVNVQCHKTMDNGQWRLDVKT